MAADYERWLIARGNVFAPSALAVIKLVERLRKENWIIDPASADLAKLRFSGKREEKAKETGGYAVTTVDNTFGSDVAKKIAASTEPQPAALTKEWLEDPDREELRLVWPVAGITEGEPLPLKYPLSLVPEKNVQYAFEIHRAAEYVYPIADAIDPLLTNCKCGEDLEFEWDPEEVVPAFGAATGIFAECEECSRTFDPSKERATIENPFDQTKEEVAGGAAYRFAIKITCGESFVADPKLAFAPELVALLENEFGRSFYEVGATS